MVQRERSDTPFKVSSHLSCTFWDFYSKFNISGSRWKVKDLTYRVSKYPVGGLTTEEVDKTIAEALKLWSDITELTFTRKETGQVQRSNNKN